MRTLPKERRGYIRIIYIPVKKSLLSSISFTSVSTPLPNLNTFSFESVHLQNVVVVGAWTLKRIICEHKYKEPV